MYKLTTDLHCVYVKVTQKCNKNLSEQKNSENFVLLVSKLCVEEE